MQDNNEPGFISQARNKAKNLNAVKNFRERFCDFDKPETAVAILCVCDRLLTGFDAPVEQAMYLDKNSREHDLLQTIARVNHPKGPEEHGIVVDYFGVANYLKKRWPSMLKKMKRNCRNFLNTSVILIKRYR